jgi:Alginate lyase
MSHPHSDPPTHVPSPAQARAQARARSRRLTVLLLLLTALASLAPKLAPAAIAALGLGVTRQAMGYTVYLPIVAQPVTGIVFTSPAFLEDAEARAARIPLNTLAQRQLLARAGQILADGGNEGNARFGWESGPLYLAYAYHITGEGKYADLAAQVLKRRMFTEEPQLQNREDYSLAAANEVLMRSQRTTARAQTYALLSGYTSPAWTSGDKERTRGWLREFGRDLRDGFAPGSCITNAKWFHLEGIAAAGAATDDQALLDFAFTAYKRYLDSATCGGLRVIGSQGLFDHEMRRFAEAGDDTWYYAGYSMLGMVRLAEIARNQGVNLYDYKSSDGRSLRLALDAHVPYLLDQPWPHDGGNVSYPTPHREFMQAYEIANAYWPDEDYLKVLQKFGDKRRAGELTDCLGPAAYLYANSGLSGEAPPSLEPVGEAGG